MLIVYVFASERARTTTVKVRLIDSDSGNAVPAMVCITGAADGAVRLPPDGRISRKPNTTAEFTRGIDYRADRDWIGPVRKTTGKGNNRDRSYVYGLDPSLPFWNEPATYQTSGEFSIELPQGRWRIAVSRGMEYVPVMEEFATSGGGDLEKTIGLKRWIDLAGEGWYSGDIHVHHPTLEKSHRDYLLEYARAEDVRVVNVLEYTHHSGRYTPQAGFGEKGRFRKGDYWLSCGQEGPRSTFGHIIGLNIDKIHFDLENYDFYDLAFRSMHESKRAVVGFAHFSWNGCSLPRGFPWYVTTREIDFVEVLQFARLNKLDYHDYLNLGFRLSAAAGSDVPWGSTLGEVRTYVYTGPTLDLDRWFAGLKVGRTFVTNGPALELTADGNLPGSTLEKAQGSALRVRAKLRSHPRIGKPRILRIVSNDGVLKEIAPSGEKHELDLDLELPLDGSRWLAASAECENGAVAHTSPIYVVVDGRPTWCPVRGPKLIEKQIEAIEKIRKEFSGKNTARSRGVLERLKKAVRYYDDLKTAMERARR